jgi:hypothetical protein
MPELESILDRLIRHEVEFVIVGGFAAVAHGASLLTEDLDVCCRFELGNLLRLESALKGLHPVHRMTPARLPLELSPDLVQRLRNLYLETDLGQLDCLSEVAGIGDFAAVAKESLTVEMSAGPCRILTLDALIRSKQAMDRPRDRAAVFQLRAIKEKRGSSDATKDDCERG